MGRETNPPTDTDREEDVQELDDLEVEKDEDVKGGRLEQTQKGTMISEEREKRE